MTEIIILAIKKKKDKPINYEFVVIPFLSWTQQQIAATKRVALMTGWGHQIVLQQYCF